jgi:zinc transport system substrate-binding protein
MAENIVLCLAEIDPSNKELYLRNSRQLQSELRILDKEISSILAPHQGGAFLVFHPAWAYFAADYGLTEIAIEDEGQEPSARRLRDLVDKARRQNMKTIFVSPPFATASAAAVAREIGAGLVELAPLSEDYIANLKRAASLLDENFRR